VPIDAQTGVYASVGEPATWTDYATAQQYARDTEGIEGIGFVFTADDPFAGVDLDACRDLETGAVEDWAVDVLRRLDSYTERSPSDTGFHVIVRGAVSDGGNRAGDLEMYDCNRYFTVTGNRVPGAPTEVAERGAELRAVHAKYIAADDADDAESAGDAEPVTDVDMSDAVLFEKARNAANGDKFQRLWNGDTSGYPSHSEADLALCTLLAFWTGGDAARIEALFAQSGLVRDKWRDRVDYRERTIQTAIRHCSEFYDPTGDT
jgi:primase-polymerase (primpol)-like protein